MLHHFPSHKTGKTEVANYWEGIQRRIPVCESTMMACKTGSKCFAPNHKGRNGNRGLYSIRLDNVINPRLRKERIRAKLPGDVASQTGRKPLGKLNVIGRASKATSLTFSRSSCTSTFTVYSFGPDKNASFRQKESTIQSPAPNPSFGL